MIETSHFLQVIPAKFADLVQTGHSKVDAKSLVEQARAATKTDRCLVLQRIAGARLDDADEPVFRALVEAGLTLQCPIDHVQITVSHSYPYLQPRKLLEAIAERGFLNRIIGVPADKAPSLLQSFWQNFKRIHPTHELFRLPEGSVNFERLLPYYCHGDGGRGYKKGSIMILSMYPCMGRGTSMCPSNLNSPASSLVPSAGLSRRLCGKRTHEESATEFDMGVNLLGHSLSNRFLFAAMNAEKYKSERAIFEGLLNAWGEQLASLFDDGFHYEGVTWKVLILGLTGDAPFLREAGLHNRSFSNAQKSESSKAQLPGICWLCAAGKAGGPRFEEVGLIHADWIQTTGAANELPWSTPGPLLQHLPLDEVDLAAFYRPDLFHILHAGVYKDCSASALIYIMKTLLKRRSIGASLELVNEDLKHFLRTHKSEKIHFSKLTLDLLGYSSSRDYPSGHWSKNLDSATIMKLVLFILRKPEHVQRVQSDPILTHIKEACEHSNTFMRTLFASGYWLSFSQADEAIRSGHGFLMAYSFLAKATFQKQLCLFALKPKLHMLNHLVLAMYTQRRLPMMPQNQGQPTIVNPVAESTFMCEDFIGRVARISRKVSPKKVGEKTLFRYLAASLQALNEAS